MVVRAVHDLIRKTPGRMGGSACVRDTRIAVWNLVAYRRLGATDDQLLTMYPGLTADDLSAAWGYADVYAPEIDRELRANADPPGGG